MSVLRFSVKRTGAVRVAVLGLCVCAIAEAGPQPAAGDGKTYTTIAFVGDLIFQSELQRRAMSDGARYGEVWRAVDPVFQSADAVYGNVEGTLARDITYTGAAVDDPGRRLSSPVYSAPPELLNFNYHYSLAADLKTSGFRIVSTGNNHALDRGSSGIDQTIALLTEQGITAVGTRDSRSLQEPWERVVKIGQLNVGWVACTYGTNGHADVLDQVLDCYLEKTQTLDAISRLAARADVDAVFFVPHWGIENHTVVALDQEALAREAAHAGATAIVGTHPHVLQEWQQVTDGQGRMVPVVYSTGNFVSGQSASEHRRGIIVLATLHKTESAAKARLHAFKYLTTEFVLPDRNVRLTRCDAPQHVVLPPEAALKQPSQFPLACE